MSDSARTGGHRQILAIDEGDDGEPSDAVAVPRAWIRRRAPVLVVAAVLAVTALLGAQALFDARERDRLAYLADIPGVLQPVPNDVAALWRWSPAETSSLVADDTAERWTIGTHYQRRDVDLRGIDPDTGAVRWTAPFPVDDALPADARDTFPTVWVRCVSASTTPRPRAVCGADLGGVGRPAGTPLLVLDPTDGTVLERQVLDVGTLWAVSAGRLVVARPIADDETHLHWDLRATDPSTGDLVWHDRTPPVRATGTVRTGDTPIDSEATLTSDTDRVLLSANGQAWLWSSDGESRPGAIFGAAGTTQLGRSQTLVWSPSQIVSALAGLLITEGGDQVAVDGVRADLAVDDGSARGVVLLRTGPAGTTLVAHDAGSGDELWRATVSPGDVLVLDGAVVTAGASSVVARDARTGDERWTARLDAVPSYVGADPLHVVVLTDDLRLRALDLADGRTAMSASVGTLVGDEVGQLDNAHENAGRLLLTFRDGSVVALG